MKKILADSETHEQAINFPPTNQKILEKSFEEFENFVP
jgi:hypothetical protein